MDIQQPLALLGGLTPAQFMRRHWQKKPLLVRQAIPQFSPPVLRADLFALAQPFGYHLIFLTRKKALKIS